MAAVRAELLRQGWAAGEEPVWRALKGRLSRYRVRQCLRELKAERKRSARQHAEAARVSVRVLGRDAVWALDATHVARDEQGRAVQAEVLRDLASGRTVGLSIGLAATTRDVIRLLRHTARERGGLPLVLVTDNGGPYKSRGLARWLARHGVVHLKTLPRTPQHNAACEHGHGELKQDAELPLRRCRAAARVALVRLLDSATRLDGHRLRATRAWQTAVEADAAALPWTVRVSRNRFYATAHCRIDRAVLHSNTGRARRRAVRNAILHALEDFKLITITRGGVPCPAPFAEDVL